jgi:hypothetical protein
LGRELREIIIAELREMLRDKDSDFGIFLNHNSSFGGIEEVLLDDSCQTRRWISYGHRSKMQVLNYGRTRYQREPIYMGVYEPLNARISANPNDIDVNVSYLSYGLSGNVDFFDSVFKQLEVKFMGLSSGEDASEYRVRVMPQLAFDVEDTDVSLGLEVDYLTGTFNNQGLRPAQTDYSYVSVNVNPKINFMMMITS